jgi:hypothetical protein
VTHCVKICRLTNFIMHKQKRKIGHISMCGYNRGH